MRRKSPSEIRFRSSSIRVQVANTAIAQKRIYGSKSGDEIQSSSLKAPPPGPPADFGAYRSSVHPPYGLEVFARVQFLLGFAPFFFPQVERLCGKAHGRTAAGIVLVEQP